MKRAKKFPENNHLHYDYNISRRQPVYRRCSIFLNSILKLKTRVSGFFIFLDFFYLNLSSDVFLIRYASASDPV